MKLIILRLFTRRCSCLASFH